VESFCEVIMNINLIPDDMMFISKLEYQALIDENEFLRLSLRNKDNYISEQKKVALDGVTAQILKLPKNDEYYTYFVQINCGDIPKTVVLDFLKALRELLDEAGINSKNVILVPTRDQVGQIKISKICAECPLKPNKFSWNDIIRQALSELEPAGVLSLPEISAKEKDLYQQLITIKNGTSFSNFRIRQKLQEKRNEQK